MIKPQDLKVVSEFEDLSEEDLTWLVDHMEEAVFESGEEPFEHGAEATHMIVILEGGVEIRIQRGDAWRTFGTFGVGRITGLLPYSRMTHFTGKGRAMGRTRVGMIPKTDFPEMLYRIPLLGQRLIGLMSDRVRIATRADQERDKMLALGKLSAGLAHELNNPAAAVRRAASELRDRIARLPGIVAALGRHGLDPATVNPESGYCALSPDADVTAVELGDREDAVLDWLEDHEVPDAWELAPTLAENGLTAGDLERAAGEVPEGAIPDMIRWMELSLGASRLLEEIHAAAGRISELVGSVKTYSHMDRSAEKQDTDIGGGLKSTLTMLGHKLREKNIQVEKDLQEIPAVRAHPGELNQVWTNLIDNAVDAMEDGGTLTVRTEPCGDRVRVHIEDNGGGIPQNVLPHIFEPFYSTKDVGKGTGLGLEIAHRIITAQHQGEIKVESRPGRTVFTVDLPAP